MEDCCLLHGLRWIGRRCCPRKLRKLFKRLKTASNNTAKRSTDDNKEHLASSVPVLKGKKESSNTQEERGRERKRTKRTPKEREESSLCLRAKKRPRTSTGSSEQEKKRCRYTQKSSQNLKQQKERAEERLEERRRGKVPMKRRRSMEERSLTAKRYRSLLPMTLSGFTFHSELGEGSFGKVMLASVPGRDSMVAVKAIRKTAINPQDLLKERRILEMARDSPFLCHGYAAFQTETCALLMMEHMAGGSLQSYMKRDGCLTETTAAFYSAEIICGIQFLHSRGVIHRDLNPDNILLDAGGHARICDFGLVAEGIFGEAETDGHCGTFLYMAPEIHLNKAYGVAVDWWSFGVILFQMLNGALPFYIYGSIVKESPRYIKELSEEAHDILKHLLMKDPQDRLWIAGCIRRHPFFQNIGWEDIESRRSTPPYQPLTPNLRLQEIPFVLDTTEDSSYMSSSCDMSSASRTPPSSGSQSLSGFSFVTPDWMA